MAMARVWPEPDCVDIAVDLENSLRMPTVFSLA